MKTIDERVFDLKLNLVNLEKELEAIKQDNYYQPKIDLRISSERKNYPNQKVIIREANEINYNFLFQEFFSQGFNLVKISKL